MPPAALALVVLAAVLHATWNIAAKKASVQAGGKDEHFVFISCAATCVLWLPAGLWFGWQEVPRWGWIEWAAVATSAAVHLAYFRSLVFGYRVGDLTVVYPLARGTGPLITAAAAVLLLGETLGLIGAAGVLAVCGGVFLVAGGPALFSRLHDADAEHRARTRAGLRWGLITGVLIAAYSVIDGYAIKVLLIGPVVYDYLCNLLRLPPQLPLLWRDAPGVAAAWRLQWRHALVVAALGPAAYICVLYALQMAPLSHVAPARELSLLVAALIGGKLLGERDRGLRLAGAAFIAGGVMMLALG